MQFLYSSLPLIDLKGCFTHYKWILTTATLHSLLLKTGLPMQWQLCDLPEWLTLAVNPYVNLLQDDNMHTETAEAKFLVKKSFD